MLGLKAHKPMVRSDWDRVQRHIDEKMKLSENHEADVRVR
jgi:hypothetical protein